MTVYEDMARRRELLRQAEVKCNENGKLTAGFIWAKARREITRKMAMLPEYVANLEMTRERLECLAYFGTVNA